MKTERLFCLVKSMSDKRQIILETALTLFRAHGYHAVGIDRVIAESAVAKMTMYKYFPSKNALIEAVLSEQDKGFRASLVEFVNRSNDAGNKIRAIFLWHHRWFKESTFNGCMFINAVAEYPELNNSIRQESVKHKEIIQDFIESTISPILPKDISHRLASQFAQLLDGAIIAVQIAGDGMAAFVAWRTAVSLLKLEGIDIDLGSPFRSK